MTRETAQPAVVRLERIIPAPPEQVYRAWLEPDLMRRWLAPAGLSVSRVEVDERAGGHHRIWQTGARSEGPARHERLRVGGRRRPPQVLGVRPRHGRALGDVPAA
jgi:uncharacterized protein YndB with AHSA1/START domain